MQSSARPRHPKRKPCVETSFSITHAIHHQISKATGIFLDARKSGLDIRYATVSDGFPLGFDWEVCEAGHLLRLGFHEYNLVNISFFTEPALVLSSSSPCPECPFCNF